MKPFLLRQENKRLFFAKKIVTNLVPEPVFSYAWSASSVYEVRVTLYRNRGFMMVFCNNIATNDSHMT